MSQAQRVCHDAHARQAHCCGAEHGRELPAGEGEEHTRGQRDADAVVEQRPEQVLLDVADRGARELDGAGDIHEVAAHEHHVGTLLGDVGAGADGKAHIGARQGGGVIDAVAHHGDLAARVLQLAHVALLVGGQHVGNNLLAAQSHAPGDGLGRHAVVAGEHAHVDAERAQRGDSSGARLLNLIGHGNGSGKLTVLGKEQRCLAFGGKLLGEPLGRGDPQLPHQLHVAGGNGVLPLARRDATAGHSGKVLNHARDDPARLALGHNRLGQWVLALAL